MSVHSNQADGPSPTNQVSALSTATKGTFISDQPGTLYVVATPIGNLADVSDRMRHILSSVSKIAAEDTRRTKHLLSHIGIDTPCFSFHDHNERQKQEWLVQLLQAGESIALVSDAGTPLISDPGFPLVRELRKKNMNIVAVPGPCALIAALSIAGLPSDRFVFEGFLPAKSGARLQQLERIATETATSIIYESSHRVKACLADMKTALGGQRRVVLARELTKTFETVLDGEVDELILLLDSDPNQSKGEFVLMISGASKNKDELSCQAKILAIKLVEHLPKKQVAKLVAETFEEKRNAIYQFLLEQT